jgi:vancomycin permeability regulator SanA
MFIIILKLVLILLVGAAVVFILPRLITGLYAIPRIQSQQKVNSKPVAIVFGAGLWWDGSPTPVLRDRVQAAAELYFNGKVKRLLMSGTTIGTYNEPRAMRNYAMSLGIPNEVIVQDYGGLRTYDTCYRALHIYGVQQAILVTQNFHLPRALYLCNALGLDVEGVSADLREYRQRSLLWWNLREMFATLVALWEVHVQPPEVILGDPEPIIIGEAQ